MQLTIEAATLQAHTAISVVEISSPRLRVNSRTLLKIERKISTFAESVRLPTMLSDQASVVTGVTLM